MSLEVVIVSLFGKVWTISLGELTGGGPSSFALDRVYWVNDSFS